MPSSEDPTRYYRWRGRTTGEDIIVLRSEWYLYKMTFSDNGNTVKGTWGTHGQEPGLVEFRGVKSEYYQLAHDWRSVHDQWDGFDEAAYDMENRDRWRRY
jgi:hypothetical protein